MTHQKATLFFIYLFIFFVGRPKRRVLVTPLSQLGLQFLIVHITRTASMVKMVTTKTFSNMHITCVVKTPECSVFIKKSHFVQCSYCKFSTTITTIIIQPFSQIFLGSIMDSQQTNQDRPHVIFSTACLILHIGHG